jgi:hypothetical protein
MRAAISLLVTTLAFGSFVIVGEGMSNVSEFGQSSSEDQTPVAKAITGKKPKPKTPYRGSGRRELMQYVGHTSTVI